MMTCFVVRSHLLKIVKLLLIFSVVPCNSVWEKFDMVRPFKGGHGSEGRTPWIKITLPVNKNSSTNGDDDRGIISDRRNVNFGSAVANIGDLNGDGVDDIAVGAVGEDVFYAEGDGGGEGPQANAGGIYILFMNKDGYVDESVHISATENGGPRTLNGDEFGFSIAGVGDLNDDGILDIAVGAPGIIVPSVYILFMQKNGTVGSHRLIRGAFTGPIPANATNDQSFQEANSTTGFVPNGPEVRYGGRLGTALAAMGDIDGDGLQELAVSAIVAGGGKSIIHILFFEKDGTDYGTVRNYATFGGKKEGGGPNIPKSFTGFGSGLVALPDMDGDDYPEIAIGAKDMEDPGTPNTRSGKAFVCFLNRDGEPKSCQKDEIQENSRPDDLPMVPFDQCGTSMAFIGDVNRDEYRSKHRGQKHRNPRKDSIPDFLMGCPQGNTGNLPGKFLIIYLEEDGELAGSTEIPAATDEDVKPDLQPLDQFGYAMAGYWDIDDNGTREVIVGAPGDDEEGDNAGAIYIIFLRSRRHHPPDFDLVGFVLMITLPTCCFCTTLIASIVFFFWYFRRRPDEVEIIVEKSGFQMQKKRKRYVKSGSVYAEEYTV